VQILFAAAPGTADYIRSGKLRALALTATSQADVLRELPTIGTSLPAMMRANGTALPRRPRRPPTSSAAEPGNQRRVRRRPMKARFATIAGEMMPGPAAAFRSTDFDELEVARWFSRPASRPSKGSS